MAFFSASVGFDYPRESKTMVELENEVKYFNRGKEGYLSSLKSKNYYDRLGISSGSNTRDIKQQYRMLTLKWHPDMSGKLGPVFANKERYTSFMSEVFILLKEAYQILVDDGERKRYDSLFFRRRG